MIFKDKSEMRTGKYYITHKGFGLEKPADLRSSNWVRRYVKTLLTLAHRRPRFNQIFDHPDLRPESSSYSRLVLVNWLVNWQVCFNNSSAGSMKAGRRRKTRSLFKRKRLFWILVTSCWQRPALSLCFLLKEGYYYIIRL